MNSYRYQTYRTVLIMSRQAASAAAQCGFFTIFLLNAFLLPAGLRAATPGQLTQTSYGASIVYSGADGNVEYDWFPPKAGSMNSLGTVAVKSNFLKTGPSELDFNPAVVPSHSDLVFQGAAWVPGPSGAQWAFTYTTNGGIMQILVIPSLSGKALRATFYASSPVISALKAGPPPVNQTMQTVPVPYYSGYISYAQPSNLFVNTYFDWNSSNGTWIDPASNTVQYSLLTNGTYNYLQETLVISVSPVLSEVFPALNNPKSPYMSKIAGQVVMDIWEGSFREIADRFRSLQSFGIGSCIALLHRWQRSGYDNALPAHLPANAALGGDTELRGVTSAAAAGGHLLGLHENYVDYYPDYDYYNPSSVMLMWNGMPFPTTFNPDTGLQSYGTKPTRFIPNAQTQSPLIHNSYNTKASYIDVNSAIMPFSRADVDSREAGSGTHRAYAAASQALWSFARATHSGPVFGEGRNHWFWSGLLDGVQAQTGTGAIAQNAGTHMPTMVDFDLNVIHPLQVNHGMGLYERWTGPGEDITHTDIQDAYRMQEVIFGHAPYLGSYNGNDFWSVVPKILVEQNLVGTVARRYGTQTAASIQYQFKGNWLDGTSAAKAGDWSRPMVKYSNGDTIVANGQLSPLVWQGYTLPQYGWLAQGTNLLAYTALRNGNIVDYAETPSLIFANARNQADLTAAPAFAQPSVQKYSHSGNTFSFQLQWKLFDYNMTDNYSNFVHVVKQGVPQQLLYQCDHAPGTPVASWKPGQTVVDPFSCTFPGTLPAGTYQLLTGLVSIAYDSRLQMLGVDPYGDRRYLIGTLNVTGGVITFVPAAPLYNPPDARLNAAGTVVDFDTVRTDGILVIAQDGGGWTLRTYPKYRDVTVQIKSLRLPQPASIACDGAAKVSAISGGYWQIALNGSSSCRWN